jgi:hypothetical protein
MRDGRDIFVRRFASPFVSRAKGQENERMYRRRRSQKPLGRRTERT